MSADQLYGWRAGTGYWSKYITYTIGSSKMRIIPKCIIGFCLKVYMEYSRGVLTLNEYLRMIIKHVSIDKIKEVFPEIRDLFCTGRARMNVDKFKFLEKGLREYGSHRDKTEEVTKTIINLVIRDRGCQALMKENFDFYADIINASSNKNLLNL